MGKTYTISFTYDELMHIDSLLGSHANTQANHQVLKKIREVIDENLVTELNQKHKKK